MKVEIEIIITKDKEGNFIGAEQRINYNLITETISVDYAQSIINCLFLSFKSAIPATRFKNNQGLFDHKYS